jgi:glycosyltransferase involved in cell wall biosynthesis
MKILYLSCHETLEFDELKVLDKLGHQVFSFGHYIDPRRPCHPTKSEKLDIKIDEELLEKFKFYHNYDEIVERFDKITIKDILGIYYKKIHKEFAKLFDVLIVAHFEENLTLNWDSFKNKPVIVRYIGQPQTHFSPYVSKVKKVAYSNTEKYINRFHDFDAVIRPYVDTNYYQGWTGEKDYVLTINKWMKKRGDYSAWNTYLDVTAGFNRIVGGFENEDISFSAGDLSPAEIQKLRVEAGVYFSTCTKPGPFTYSFMEALSTGIPTVSIGPKIGSVSPDKPTFEAHTYIENGVSGFWSDDVKELRGYLQLLLEDKNLARQISKGGREAALKYFSIDKNMADWKNLLEKL